MKPKNSKAGKSLNHAGTSAFIVLVGVTLAACSQNTREDGLFDPLADEDSLLNQAPADTDPFPEMSKEFGEVADVVDEVEPETDPWEESPPADEADAWALNEEPGLEDPVTNDPSYNEPVVTPDEPQLWALDGSLVQNNGMTYYKLAQGETLMQIAYYYYGDLTRWKDIHQANANQVNDPNRIAVGTELYLPDGARPIARKDGELYKIKKGDTLAKISQKLYGDANRWKDLYKHNQDLIKDPSRIYAGFFLSYLPQGADSYLGKEEDPEEAYRKLASPEPNEGQPDPSVAPAPEAVESEPQPEVAPSEEKDPLFE